MAEQQQEQEAQAQLLEQPAAQQCPQHLQHPQQQQQAGGTGSQAAAGPGAAAAVPQQPAVLQGRVGSVPKGLGLALPSRPKVPDTAHPSTLHPSGPSACSAPLHEPAAKLGSTPPQEASDSGANLGSAAPSQLAREGPAATAPREPQPDVLVGAGTWEGIQGIPFAGASGAGGAGPGASLALLPEGLPAHDPLLEAELAALGEGFEVSLWLPQDCTTAPPRVPCLHASPLLPVDRAAAWLAGVA